MSGVRSRYSREFKIEAIKLFERIGIIQASKELGVSNKSLYSWKKSFSLREGKSESKFSSISELELENRRLRKENKNLRMIAEVLKKSTAIFSRDQI